MKREAYLVKRVGAKRRSAVAMGNRGEGGKREAGDMKTISSVKEMQAVSLQARREDKRIGLVPTMGFLHEGHLSLIRKARQVSDLLVVSIFVNPTQFGPGEDFASYPRDIQRDNRLCGDEGVNVVFYPPAGEMYADDHSVYVEETELSAGLCGASRPGHFRGVATIVAKLFNIVRPDIAVFGQKDAQQARVIEQMVRDLNFPVEIIIAPIVREPDGLAMSSRNSYLSAQERERATCIYKSLCLAKSLYNKGTKETAVIRKKMREAIMGERGTRNAERGRTGRTSFPETPSSELRAPSSEVSVDYIETVDYRTLKPVDRIEDATLVAVAVKIGGTRLIDNVILGKG